MMPQKGVLILTPICIKLFKAKDRQAAEVLQDVGFNEISWFKNENAVKHYICSAENCNEFFTDLYLLKNHFFKTHNGRPFKCDFNNCKWSFATKSKLERHKNSHLNLKWYKCVHQSCCKTFTTLYNLKQHLKTIHEKADQFVCDVNGCSAAFHNQRSLDLHKATHQNLERAYTCDQVGCDKTFVTKNALCSHRRSHEHKLEDLKCSWQGCDKVFELPCRLREHMRIHTGEKPFKCDYPGCSWSFYSGSKLHRHRNKHLQIRKYVCGVNHCKKSFLRSQHLKEHILTHSKTDSKIFPCSVENCDSKFSSKNLVYRHVKKFHQLDRKKSEMDDELEAEFGVQIPGGENIQPADQSQLLNAQCISQLDTMNLLTGDYDVCSAENVPLNTHLPELMSSELLVAMTSMDTGSGDSLADITAVDNNHPLVVMAPIEANNNETLIDNVHYIVDNSLPSKNNKKKSNGFGSARTNYTYKDIVKEKTYKAELEDSRRMKWLQNPDIDGFKPKKWKSSKPDDCKLTTSPDVVFTSGMGDQIVKDEFYSQDDLQVWLLDQSKVRNRMFEASTINLRDLE